MNARLVLGLGLLAGLVLGLLRYGYWIGPQAASLRTLPQAEFSVWTPDEGETSTHAVALPHKWPAGTVTDGMVALYRVALPPEALHTHWAISLAESMPGTEVFVGGRKLPLTEQTGHVGEVLLAELGDVSPGTVLTFRVPPHFGLCGGLGVIHAGPKAVLARQARLLSVLREISHLWIIGMTLAFAVFSLGAYWMRGDRLLLALGVTASSIALHHLLPFVWGYWEGDGLELALYSATSSLTAVSLFFLLELATRHRRDVIAIAALLGLPIVIGLQFSHLLAFESRRLVGIGYILILMSLAVVRHVRPILSQKQWLLLLLLVFFVVRALFAARSYLLNHGLFGFDDVEHQVRLTPFAMLAAMLLGARHIHVALQNYEMANIGMAREIETYKSELAAATERERSLAIQQAASAERLHWMQEIHDGLGSHLIAARFLADRSSESPEGLEAVKQSIDDSIEDLRELVESLSPEQATVPSLLGALRYRVAPRYEKAGLTLLWSVDPMIEAGELTAAEAINVQRITQEALTNILKHADARTVRMHIFTRGPSIVLRIEDDGKGFDPALPNAGRGMANMRKRARDCRGELTVTALNPGTRIELSLPNNPGI